MNKRWYRTLIIVELLILYFTLLTLISYCRGQVKYQYDMSDNLVERMELVLFSDPDAMSEINGAHIYVRNPGGGTFGVSAPISLRGVEILKVQFKLFSPESYSGREIHIDLMGDGYDSDAQESVFLLQGGSQNYTCELRVGDNAPDEALFRIFCLESVECEISEIGLFIGKPVPKVLPAHWIAVMAAALLLAITLITGSVRRKRNQRLKAQHS